MFKKLRTGAAYHGNRMTHHVISDMHEMAMADMDIVVHMLSHMDMERHSKAMADIFKASEAEGLEVWVDNFGLWGEPGDKAHFLMYHPEAKVQFSDGSYHPFKPCFNSPEYRQFTKDWIDKVRELGGKIIFWDEPNLPLKRIDGTNDFYSGCACPTCKKRFEERFGKPMPIVADADVAAFRSDTIYDFHYFITEYSKSLGMKNVITLLPNQMERMYNKVPFGSEIGVIDVSRICSIEHIDDFGTDPYWFGTPAFCPDGNPYEYVYNSTKACVEVADRLGKESHLWIQGYGATAGREPEIITASEAAYDAGARTILSWSFMGGEANNYRSQNPEKTWMMTKEAFKRIKSINRDEFLEENRKKYKK